MMRKLSLLNACGWFVAGIAWTSFVQGQVKVVSSVPNATTKVVAVPDGVGFGDSVDELSLMNLLGISELQAAQEDYLQWNLQSSELIWDDSTPSTDDPIFTVPNAVVSGPLNGPSPIRTKNFHGIWQTAGSVDLKEILGAAWALGGNMLEQQVREYLVNVRYDYHRFRLNGFYDISVNLSDPSTAIATVQVSGDKKQMFLTYDIPGNEVSCTANLTSPFGWPDRDFRVRTTVRIEVAMDVTGNLTSPTRIREFRVSLRDTDCWNDGILFRETMNEKIENAMDNVSVLMPLNLGQLLFSTVNTRIRAKVTASTTRLFFEYDPAVSSVAFKLDSNSIVQPPMVSDALQLQKVKN